MAALLFAVQTLFPIVHRAVGARYMGFTHLYTVAIDIGLALIWGASAIAGLIQRPRHAFFVMLAGTAVTFIHFLMFSVITGAHGPRGASLPWLVAFAVQAYWTVRAAPAFFAPARTTTAQPRERAAPSPGSPSWWPPRLRQGAS